MPDTKNSGRGKPLFSRPYRRFGSIVPKNTRAYIEKRLAVAGIDEETRVWLGKRLLLAFCTGLILLFFYLVIYNPITTTETINIAAGLFAIGFAGVLLLFYLQLYFRIANRTSAVEKILPDFLLLTISNLRAGMTPFVAFTRAARPEFGALYDEVRLSAAKAGGKTSLAEVLEKTSLRFDSQIFRRTVELFAKGIKSGGQLTRLLSSSAEEVRRIQDLRAELITSTRTYSIFLGFIIVMVMPFLLAVSTHFITIFVSIQMQGGTGAVDTEHMLAGAPTLSGKIGISAEQMTAISVITLIITSLLVSCLIGIIGRGRALYGVKYFPLLAAASVAMFFIAKTVVASLLSGFAGT